jgi:anti-anti-sigma regulatory factor
VTVSLPVELQHAVIEVLRRQRPACIDIDLAQVGLLDCAGAVLLCKADAVQLDCQIRAA